ncbi:DMT family transporter [uncultured Marixanthomonas sp.]|uniref:DMT family transporter n=1 Tax=uncultured Marixanthomonas sp. TaxID=757245 RepID=UPI0030D751E3|tara:strand:+ start:16394 stop:17299 length:906 start_codon:yes stop_codon:yes gene_type:complete
MKNQKQAYMYAGIAVLLWSTVATSMKIALQSYSFLQLLFWSSATALMALSILMLVTKKYRNLAKLPPKAILKSAFYGAVNPFLYYIVLFKTYDLLPAQEAQALNYTWPIMLSLLAVPLLKQKISIKNIMAIGISFIGVLIIATGGNLINLSFTREEGVLLGLASAIIWALFWIFNIKDERDELSKLFFNFCFGFVYIVIALLFTSEVVFINVKTWLNAVYVGLFEMGITFVIWSIALKKSITAAKVSNLVYLVPFLSLVVIYFVLEEAIQLPTIIGLFLIVGGLVFDKVSFKQLRFTKSNK